MTIEPRLRELDEKIARARHLKAHCKAEYLHGLARVRAAWEQLEAARQAVDKLEEEAAALERTAIDAPLGNGLPVHEVRPTPRGPLPTVPDLMRRAERP